MREEGWGARRRRRWVEGGEGREILVGRGLFKPLARTSPVRYI
ncbi:unnamed protein product [Spirodela intermedia]|uniref:Uncharacterized protein n=1 Tax=Spirodela intermedia TaxID=51605 RepID=A0A7I8JTL7_SPIIN|nr:unnamed protein product [Spirodela intermedia]CAA6672792.1 unnamed protein product [Spirodela intermedia]